MLTVVWNIVSIILILCILDHIMYVFDTFLAN